MACSGIGNRCPKVISNMSVGLVNEETFKRIRNAVREIISEYTLADARSA